VCNQVSYILRGKLLGRREWLFFSPSSFPVAYTGSQEATETAKHGTEDVNKQIVVAVLWLLREG